jgi:hypothetical protein
MRKKLEISPLIMNLSADDLNSLRIFQRILQRPLVCQNGIPMGHEDVRERNSDGLAIIEPDSSIKFREECTLKHYGCPHLWRGQEQLKLKIINVLRRLHEIDVLDVMDDHDAKRDPLDHLDSRIRTARVGTQLNGEIVIGNVPTVQEASQKAAPLEDEWRVLMQKIEVENREPMIAHIQRIMKERERTKS